MKFFDIETKPLPESECELFMPEFEAPSNYKDPEKIAANIAEQRAKWMERAALSPLTGKVLAIGIKDSETGESQLFHGHDEGAILRAFAGQTSAIADAPLCGFNVVGFDVPFLVKRMWRNGMRAPKWWTAKAGFGKPPLVLDLMLEFQCGNYRDGYVKLDHVAKFLGLDGKTGEHAKNFGDLYDANQEMALEYLTRDVELVGEIHNIICV